MFIQEVADHRAKSFADLPPLTEAEIERHSAFDGRMLYSDIILWERFLRDLTDVLRTPLSLQIQAQDMLHRYVAEGLYHDVEPVAAQLLARRAFVYIIAEACRRNSLHVDNPYSSFDREKQIAK